MEAKKIEAVVLTAIVCLIMVSVAVNYPPWTVANTITVVSADANITAWKDDSGQLANPYPSISGTHNGTIRPYCDIAVSNLYTYSCAGTSGHTEYVKIWNSTNWNVTATWNGYVGDWHNLTFNNTFTLYANGTYYYTIVTGSYPQIIHEPSWNITGGIITCTSFKDANGNVHTNWIPGIRLEYKPLLQYQNPERYMGEYIFELEFDEYNTVNSLSVYVPTPTEWETQRAVELISLSPDGNISPRNTYGKYIYFDEKDLTNNALSTKQVFNFTVYEIRTDTSADNVPRYNTSSVLYIEHTKHENKIERDYFVDKIQDIIGDEENPIKRARRIYDYVIDSVRYESQGGILQGAKYCYENKEGECGDYSALFVAMCRAAGIPARPVVGFWADPTYGNVHAWAEFYVQDIGWIPVDPTIGQQSEERREYYFGNMDSKRLIMSKGYNIQFDAGTADLFQIGAYWWYGTGEHPTVRFQYNRNEM